MSLSGELAKHISSVRYEDLSPCTVEMTKRTILDTLGVILAANTLGEGCSAFVKLAVQSGGPRQSTMIGYRMKVPALQAAFVNGAMAHAMDFEEGHGEALVHASAATIPAAIAVAEAAGQISGKELITAVALGNDLTCRLGLAIEHSLLETGWYMPPILGAFGAAASAGKLLSLNEQQYLDAFSLVLSQSTCSAELINNSQSLIRSVRDAFSAKAGVMSSMLAVEGISGFTEPFEGRMGFFHAFAGGRYNLLRLVENLGSVFEGANVSFKPWPSCGGTHAFIEAAMRIRNEYMIKPEEITAVEVIVNPVFQMLCEPAQSKRRPATAIDAKFSLPFVTATALHYGNVGLDHFAAEALQNEQVLKLADKVVYQIDHAAARAEAVGGALKVITGRGAFYVKVDKPFGHPEQPMSEQMLMTKFRDCARYAERPLSDEHIDQLVERVMNLEQVKDVSQDLMDRGVL
ncbi:MmgE/PrpD family protein [Paenibacillus humicus]|uniref:MmgE/PrpD family protein n=1 Tax=Paenibacillus humicus TaxID=412861 RepID=UPI003D2BC848